MARIYSDALGLGGAWVMPWVDRATGDIAADKWPAIIAHVKAQAAAKGLYLSDDQARGIITGQGADVAEGSLKTAGVAPDSGAGRSEQYVPATQTYNPQFTERFPTNGTSGQKTDWYFRLADSVSGGSRPTEQQLLALGAPADWAAKIAGGVAQAGPAMMDPGAIEGVTQEYVSNVKAGRLPTTAELDTWAGRMDATQAVAFKKTVNDQIKSSQERVSPTTPAPTPSVYEQQQAGTFKPAPTPDEVLNQQAGGSTDTATLYGQPPVVTPGPVTPTTKTPEQQQAEMAAAQAGATGSGAGANAPPIVQVPPANQPSTPTTVTPTTVTPTPDETLMDQAGQATTATTRAPLTEAVGADGKPLTGFDLFFWAADHGYSNDEAVTLARGNGVAATSATGTTEAAGTTAVVPTGGYATPTTGTTTAPSPYTFDPEQAAQIEAFYRKPYEEAADKRMKYAETALRQVHMNDSDRVGMAALENAKKTSADIAQYVTVPLIEKEQERAYTAWKDQKTFELEQAKLTGDLEGASTLEKQLQDADLALKRGEALGFLPVTAKDLGVDVSKGVTEETAAAVWRNFEAKYGRYPTAEEAQSLYRGEGVVVAGKSSTVAGQQVEIQKRAQTWQEAIDRANSTGSLTDPDTGLSVDTLSKWKMQLDEAGVTGVYKGSDTLQAKMAIWDQTSQDKATFGFDEDRVVNGVTTKVHVYGTNELQLAVQKNDQTFKQMLEQGWDYVDPDTGETRRVMGTDERSLTDFQRTEMQRSGYDTPVLGADGQPMHETKQVQATYDANGTRVYNQTQAEVLAAGGSVKTITEQTDNLVMRHVEGTQEASSRIKELELDLQDKGLDQEDAHFQATLTWDKQQRDGYYQLRGVTFDQLGLSAADFTAMAVSGVDMTQFLKADGSADFDKFFQWADDPINNGSAAQVAAALTSGSAANSPIIQRLRAVLGRMPNQQEVMDLLQGKTVAALDADGKPQVDYITGTVGLEEEKNQLQQTLQQNGFTHDQAMAVADRNYQDKVRDGYWTVNETGHQVWVYGTQTQEERLLTLQNTLQISREDAQRKWDEDQRVGYDEVVTVKSPNGQTYTQSVHVMGTQEFAAEQTADTWAHQEALTWGYYTTVNGQRVWRAGSQEHETSLQTMRDDLVKAGWAADEAGRQAEYIRQQSTTDRTYLGQQYQDQRKWYYENVEGMPASAAATAAAADWNGVKDQFGDPLQVTLEQMRIDAAKEQFDAQTEIGNLQTAFQLLGGLSGDLMKLFMGNNGVGALGNNNGVITRAVFKASGFTDAQADEAMAAVGRIGGGNSTDANGNPVGPLAMDPTTWGWGDTAATAATQSFSSKLLSNFGSSYTAALGGTLTAGASLLGTITGLATVGIVAYGVYKGVQKVVDFMQGPGEKAKEETARFDDWFNTLSLSDQEAFRSLLESAHVSWSDRFAVTAVADGRSLLSAGSIFGLSNGNDIRTTKAVQDFSAALDAFGSGSTTTTQQFQTIRELIDGGVFKKDAGAVTLEEEGKVNQAWRLLPGVSRTTNATFEQKFQDLASFALDTRTMSTAQLDTSLKGLVTGSVLTKTTGNLTRDERQSILSLYDQLGSVVRWNATATVEQKQQALATYASSRGFRAGV